MPGLVLPDQWEGDPEEDPALRDGVDDKSVGTDGKQLKPEDLEVGELLGGVISNVRRCTHKETNTQLALKTIYCRLDSDFPAIEKDLKARYCAADNPYVIKFFGTYTLKNEVFIALELMDGSLADFAPVPELELALITRSVMLGLHYLHSKSIAHGDLKPQNLLFSTNGRVKVTDFGCRSELVHTMVTPATFADTVVYQPSEHLDGESCSFAGDIWSLGITLVELITGVPPFQNVLRNAEPKLPFFWLLKRHLESDDFRVELSPGVSKECRDFIERCLDRDPKARANADELLSHPWIAMYSTGSREKDEQAIATWLVAAQTRVANTIDVTIEDLLRGIEEEASS